MLSVTFTSLWFYTLVVRLLAIPFERVVIQCMLCNHSQIHKTIVSCDHTLVPSRLVLTQMSSESGTQQTEAYGNSKTGFHCRCDKINGIAKFENECVHVNAKIVNLKKVLNMPIAWSAQWRTVFIGHVDFVKKIDFTTWKRVINGLHRLINNITKVGLRKVRHSVSVARIITKETTY